MAKATSTPFSPTTKALGEDVQDSRRARLDAEFLVDMFQVLLHRSGAHAEEMSDLPIALALGQPAEHLGLSRGEAPKSPKRLLSQHPGIRHLASPRPAHTLL